MVPGHEFLAPRPNAAGLVNPSVVGMVEVQFLIVGAVYLATPLNYQLHFRPPIEGLLGA